MKLTKKQTLCLDYLENKKTNEILFGGGAGGAKSFIGCFWLLKNCIKYPNTRHVMGRAKLKTLKETTLNSFFEVCKLQGFASNIDFKINNQSNIIHFQNGSEILLKDLFLYPSDPNFDELGSLEITSAFVDEANQITQKARNILRSRIRYKLDEYNIIPKMLYTCNPAKNWVYSEFYKPFKENKLPENKAFLPALVTDNPFISKHYVENLKGLDENSKQRLLYGNWEYDNDPRKLIEYDNIINLFSNSFVEESEQKYISCDVARYGSDKAVIVVWAGFVIIEIFEYAKCSIMQLVDKIKEIANKHKIPVSRIVADDDGVGGGVNDFLKCKRFVNNSKPISVINKNYANLKTQCYFKLADYINQNKIYCKARLTTEQEENIKQELEIIKIKDVDYENKIYIMSKDEVKELINRSPDYSDAIMMRMFFELIVPQKTA